MSYWFVKSPFKHHSWAEILLKNKFQLFGIRNYQARNNIQKMQNGDRALFYSSSNGKKVFGIMKVISETYQDPSTSNSKWLSVDFEPIKSLNGIPLKIIKKEFPNHKITKQPRLSVVELSEEEYNFLLELGVSKNGK